MFKFILMVSVALMTMTIHSQAKNEQLPLNTERALVDQFVVTEQNRALNVNMRESCESSQITCAEASIQKSGYVQSGCFKVANDAQDLCAATSIQKSGYVFNDCLKLNAGGLCARASIIKSGYVFNDCFKIQNHRQDRCAVASIEKSGYVFNDCLKL